MAAVAVAATTPTAPASCDSSYDSSYRRTAEERWSLGEGMGMGMGWLDG